MANTILTCDTCPAMVLDSLMKTIQTSKGQMRVCKKCFADYESSFAIAAQGQSEINQIPEVLPISRKSEEIQSIQKQEEIPLGHRMSAKKDVIDPEEPKGKRIDLAELYKRAQNKTQLIIAKLDFENNAHEAYKELEFHIDLVESISYETKSVAAGLLAKKRELDAKSGKNRWDKERRGEDKTNLSDPRNSPLLSKAQKSHKQSLTKIEQSVKGMIDIGDSDDDILTMLTSTGKFKGSEIRDAIQKFRN